MYNVQSALFGRSEAVFALTLGAAAPARRGASFGGALAVARAACARGALACAREQQDGHTVTAAAHACPCCQKFMFVSAAHVSFSFYESMGFQVIGRKRDYPSAGKMALRMARPTAAHDARP
jgi:hypothetical protein